MKAFFRVQFKLVWVIHDVIKFSLSQTKVVFDIFLINFIQIPPPNSLHPSPIPYAHFPLDLKISPSACSAYVEEYEASVPQLFDYEKLHFSVL